MSGWITDKNSGSGVPAVGINGAQMVVTCDANGNPVGAASGSGDMTPVPAGQANGTPLGTPPAGIAGVRIYLKAGDSLTFTIAGAQPNSAPSATFTIGSDSTGPNWDENLSNGQMIYVTNRVGSPLFRWY